ncbi:MAG TPA: class I SAM-dependent methyltransferase [Prolixibacteraceae bacterium]|nr:class I SAM-dependent methyltransferase [Prolixibacteraceae bacterium]
MSNKQNIRQEQKTKQNSGEKISTKKREPVSGAVSYPSEGNHNCFQIEAQSFWFLHRNQVIAEIFQRFVPEGSRVFDIGGGNGFVSALLREKGYTPVLVEPGSDGIRNARERGIEHLIHARFEDAGFIDESIDHAGLFDVVEHIENDRAFLLALYNKLKPGGKVILTVPAWAFLWSEVDALSGHFRRYTLKKLQMLLYNTGFSYCYGTYFFSFLPLPIFLFRSLPGLFPFILKRKQVSRESEHRPESKTIRRIIAFFAQAEMKRFEKGKRIPFGSSCLVVAEKK